MGYAQALLRKDVRDEEKALKRKARKKDLWGSIGRTAGTLGIGLLTGGAVNPLTLGLLTGGASALGGAIGSRAAGGSLKGGKFFSEDREELQSQLGALGSRNLLESLKSGVTAGIGQAAKLKKAGIDSAKGLDFGDSFIGKKVAGMKEAKAARDFADSRIGFGAKMPYGDETMLYNLDNQKRNLFTENVGVGTGRHSLAPIPKDIYGEAQRAAFYRPETGGTRQLFATGETPELMRNTSQELFFKGDQRAREYRNSNAGNALFTPTRDVNLGGRGTNAAGPLDNFNIKDTINRNKNLTNYSWDSESPEDFSMINALEYEQPSWQKRLFESLGVNDFKDISTKTSYR
tara:strand:+ start:177 stop:1214 length:1038 start_codon:yes stop_codon:yes gene_type:complete